MLCFSVLYSSSTFEELLMLIVKFAMWWQKIGHRGRSQAKEKLFSTAIISVLVLAIVWNAPGFVRASALLVLSAFWLVTYLDLSEIKPVAYQKILPR